MRPHASLIPRTAAATDSARAVIDAADVASDSGFQLRNVGRDGSIDQNNPSKLPASASSATSNVSAAPRTACPIFADILGQLVGHHK